MQKFTIEQIQTVYQQFLEDKKQNDVVSLHKKYLSSKGLVKELLKQIRDIPKEERKLFGQEANTLKQLIEEEIENLGTTHQQTKTQIDISAPYNPNIPENDKPRILPQNGHKNPLTKELENILNIFQRMGFEIEECIQLDDDYHMFESLNFPKGHPARDNWDTFWTTEHLVPPAHTSTMQNRVLKKYEPPIRVVVPGTVFRNEATDATHEHTLFQVEGVYVDKNVSVGHMLATIKAYLEEFFEKDLKIRIQPAYFPFTEPDMEFMINCPFCDGIGCSICGHTGWIEAMGCGMIHPNVLKEGGINPDEYSGFAWGFGLDRLVMIKNGIKDVRLFRSGNLDFLKQFD